MSNKKKISVIIIGIAIGLFLIQIWRNFVDVGQVFSYIKNINLYFVLAACILYLLAYFVRSLRWGLILKPLVNLSVWKIFLIYMGGNFTNYLIPLRAGDVMKCFFIKKQTGTRVSQTLPSVLIEKLFDTVGIFLVLLMIPFLSITISRYISYIIILVLLVMFSGILLIIFSITAHAKLSALLNKFMLLLPLNYRNKVSEMLSLFVQGLADFKQQKKIIFPVFLLSILAVALDGLFFYSFFLAFSIKINFVYVLFGYTLIYLSYIIPHPPMQIGSNELIMLLVFASGFGLNSNSVSAVMVLSHFFTGVIIIVTGIAAYSYAGVQFSTVIRKGDELYE